MSSAMRVLYLSPKAINHFYKAKANQKKTALSAIPAKWRDVPQSEDLGVSTPGYHQNFLPSRIEASKHCGPSSLSILDQLLSRLPHVVQRGPQIIVLAGDQRVLTITQFSCIYLGVGLKFQFLRLLDLSMKLPSDRAFVASCM